MANTDVRSSPTAAPDEAGVLRRVAVDATMLARATVLATVVAKESGLTPEERDQVSVFIRGADVLIAFDLDRGFSRTTTGEERRLSFRFRVPATDLAGAASLVGVRVHAGNLLRALRSRETNSENYGILPGPVHLEVLAGAGAERPSAFRVYPATKGGSARVVPITGTASLAEFADVEPRTPEAHLAGLDADAMIELAGLTDPALGLLVVPETGNVVAVARNRIAVSSFGTSNPVVREADAATLPLGVDREAKAATPTAIVVSSRLATAVGFAQLGAEEALRAAQRAENARRMESVSVAALAASLEVAPERALVAVRTAAGEALVRKAAAAAAGGSEPERAVAFARTLLTLVPPGAADTILAAFSSRDGAAPAAGDLRLARALTGDEAAPAELAAALLSASDREAALRTAAEAAGEALLRDSAGWRASEGQGEVLHYAAAAADVLPSIDALGQQLRRETPAAQSAPWWDAFDRHLVALGLPEDARDHLLRGRVAGRHPAEASLTIPDSMRERWLAEAVRSAQGRMERDPATGRVYVGFDSPHLGAFALADTAIEPDPTKYPLTPADIQAAIARNRAYAWKGELYTSDLQTAADLVVGLGRAAPELPRASTVFVARWTPPGSGRADGDVLERLSPDEAWLRHPEDVELQLGGDAIPMALERSPREPAAAEETAGTLRIYGFDADGERLRMALPLRTAPTLAGRAGPIAFALDAERLHDLVAFVAQRGRQAQLTLAGGMVRLSDAARSRTILLPTLTASEVPEPLRDLVAAVGVAWQGVEVPTDEVFRRFTRYWADEEIRRARATRGLPAARASMPSTSGPAVVWREPETTLGDATLRAALAAVRERMAMARRKLAFWAGERERVASETNLFGEESDQGATRKIDRRLRELRGELAREEAVEAELLARAAMPLLTPQPVVAARLSVPRR